MLHIVIGLNYRLKYKYGTECYCTDSSAFSCCHCFLTHLYFNAPVMTKSSHFSIQSPGISSLYTGDVIWLQQGQRHQDHLLSPTATDCLGNVNNATQWYCLMLSNHWS